jgi:CubicO group peptidase (beta-lactamase class C family)
MDLMLNYGTYGGKRYIDSTTVKEFTTMYRYRNGLGWDMDPKVIQAFDMPSGTYGHTGFTGTSVVIVSKYKLSILFLTNRENVGVDEAGYYYDLAPVKEKTANLVMGRLRNDSSAK